MSKLVSVCLPTHNGSLYLSETLNSIRKQTYKNIELIISDDSSTDDTIDIIESFKKKVSFPTHITTHIPKGIGANWNNCIINSNGEYIKFVFQDDLIAPNCIELMLNTFIKYDEVGLVASKRDIIYRNKQEDFNIEEWLARFKDLQKNLNLPSEEISIFSKSIMENKDFLLPPMNKIAEPSFTMFHKSILNTTGYFRNDLSQSIDYEFYYRVLKHYKIAIINKNLGQFRLHQNQLTLKNSAKRINENLLFKKIIYNTLSNNLHNDVKKKINREFGFMDSLISYYEKIKNLFQKKNIIEDRTDLINYFIKKNNYGNYLEIGVRNPGDNFDNIVIKKKYGVDPSWLNNPKVGEKHETTSDDFFLNLDKKYKFDIILIDGLHIYEQAYKDIINSLNHLSRNGVIVVHDCNPKTEWHQRPIEQYDGSDAWNGTTWKAFVKCRTNKDLNIIMYTVDVDYGCGIIKFGNQEKYNKVKLNDCLEWKYFENNRAELLNLINVRNFLNINF